MDVGGVREEAVRLCDDDRAVHVVQPTFDFILQLRMLANFACVCTGRTVIINIS